MASIRFTVAHGKARYEIEIPSNATVTELRAAIADATGVPAQNQSGLIWKGSVQRLLGPDAPADATAAAAGLAVGTKVTVIGATVETAAAARKSEQALIRHELAAQAGKATAGRSVSRAAQAVTHRFGVIRPLSHAMGLPHGASPGVDEADALLFRIATDRGVLAIMDKYSWDVGLLSEFIPSLQTGVVGVTGGCLLGFNKNKGEEISLRLRTDDFQGFRKYHVIIETVLHELAHMIHSDHDARFHELNRKLNKEYTALDWHKVGGQALGGMRASDLRTASEMSAAAAANRARSATAVEAGGSTKAGPPTLMDEDTKEPAGGASPDQGELVVVSWSEKAEQQEIGFVAVADAFSDGADRSSTTVACGSPSDTSGDNSGSSGLTQEAEGDLTPVAAAEGTKPVPMDSSGVEPKTPCVLPEPMLIATGDPASTEKAARFHSLLKGVCSECAAAGQAPSASLSLLSRVIGNIRANPLEDKFRRINVGKPKFQALVGRFKGGFDLVSELGFKPTDADHYEYTRNDPGLLWLAEAVLERWLAWATAK